MGSNSGCMEEDIRDEKLSVDLLRLPTPALTPSARSPVSDPSEATDGVDLIQPPDEPAQFEVTRSRHITVDIPRSTLTNPKSVFQGFIPPLPRSSQSTAVSQLLDVVGKNSTAEEWVEFELNAFSFYGNVECHPNELQGLQLLRTKASYGQFYLDGVLSAEGIRHYVSGVVVEELSIGNYGIEHASVDGQIWVRTKFNQHREVYYRLGKPAIEYERFHTPFLWIANLAKHVVDFATEMIKARRQVGISSFKEDFIRWLRRTHTEAKLRAWLRQHPSTDFRVAVQANLDFIWKELFGLIGEKAWEVDLCREAITFSRYEECPKPQDEELVYAKGKNEPPERPTIVTPYIKDCFGHMVIGQMLRLAGDDAEVPAETAETPDCGGVLTLRFLSRAEVSRIALGDVISTPRDQDTTDTKWRPTESQNAKDDGRWFGLVQKIHISKVGHYSFDVIWLYRPVETPCCVMKYPWLNELFLSDHCTCEEGASARVKESEILDVHAVNWFGGPSDRGERFFIRQLYMVQERRWVTLKESHLRCSHGKEKPGFKTGDTILAMLGSGSYSESSRESSPGLATQEWDRAEPFEVVKIFRQRETRFVRLRRLLRRSDVERRSNAAPNELVYTDQMDVVRPGDAEIIGRCYVRFFRPGQPIPTPYNLNGNGNLFYITHRLTCDGQCVPLDEFPTSLRQGFDPSRKVKRMKGLDLFCGAGNFGRGLEDGGVVKMRWANDIWDRPMHTYMANTSADDPAHPFLGSVDDLLREAIEGNFRDNVPRPGEVDFISAGSPCPGFSLLTVQKAALKQVKNRSLVASFASFVDLYRPKYGILENVDTIVQSERNQHSDMLSQLFCAIVGMGYQAQLILGDAWSYGAPQTRKRVFLYFAAAGLRLPEAPLPSHSHPAGTHSRGLGKICNGEAYVQRRFGPTAFKYVSAREATADLPPIDDGAAGACIAFPDHRLSIKPTPPFRSQISAIPFHPYGMTFMKTWKEGRGLMSASDRELFNESGMRVTHPNSKGWSRQTPAGLFSTVTTVCNPTDSRSGAMLHWVDNRPLSVLEVRRAQGFPDHEVLLGSVSEQWKQVGNSVARQMALALGLKLREAWLGSLYDDETGQTEAVNGFEQATGHQVPSKRGLGEDGESERPAKMRATMPSPSRSPMMVLDDGETTEDAETTVNGITVVRL
ncbi:S-adenosyl-L-methionine-dependent methyltransferase [Echria macrotheca]|uniref:DNA (cytosine-5-)-methyltransferase n=1 Tax=Echria macrotheca TaxID=438768 RepID=A0AAJ0B982_9PEZI|nr:S-adenosyl-L-methionine-dependent methyltransferase [Echria macrotheca]